MEMSCDRCWIHLPLPDAKKTVVNRRLPVAIQNSYGAARKNTPTAAVLTVRSSRKGTGVIALSRRTQFTIAA